MKGLLRIFDLSKNEQRAVLIVMLILIVTAFAGYERRVYRSPIQPALPAEAKSSPAPAEVDDQR